MFGREISLRRAFRANCAAMRLQLVEIHDLPSCPPSLRDALTDFLAFTENLAGAYDPVGPLLRRALERTKARRIVDLCSGAGGPWRRLSARVGVPVLLTDLYPHNEDVTRVDARAVPAELDGFRTIFTAFHHFRPAEARSILGTFDGVVSCLRTYSKAELKDLLQGLDTYDWEIGDFRGRWSPLRGSYLIGVPRLS